VPECAGRGNSPGHENGRRIAPPAVMRWKEEGAQALQVSVPLPGAVSVMFFGVPVSE
jgi:hypothetical protein